RQGRQGADVGGVVLDLAAREPGRDALAEPVVGAVDGPQARVVAVHLRQPAVEVQQAHQARPLAGEVRDRQDRAAMGAQACGPCGGMAWGAPMARRWGRMKPWPETGSGSKARRSLQPAASTASPTIRSSSCWKGQAGTFALSRRSPEGIR